MRNSPIVIPLDGMAREAAYQVAKLLKGSVWGFKLNDLLHTSIGGTSIVGDFQHFGNVWADVKVHDIPNTAANITDRYAKAGTTMMTIHASGGFKMMRACIEAAGDMKILAVTILTSLSDDAEDHRVTPAHIYGATAKLTALKFGHDAVEAGVHGIVCSPHELPAFRADNTFKNTLLVVPGIRPIWYHRSDDQQRVGTPGQAIHDGADLLVIGRPITNAEDPAEAVAHTHHEIESARTAA